MDEVTSSAVTEEGTGGKEQEVAGTAAQGGKEQEVAEPAAETGKEQTPEERQRQAAARRKAEMEEHDKKLRDQINAEHAAQMDSVVASLGKINPFTKKAITTMQELNEYNEENTRRKRAAKLEKLGMSEEDFNELVENHPTVRAAKEAAAKLNEQKASLQRAEQSEELRAELAEIAKIDPNIKSAKDLMEHPSYAELKKLVQENGHSIAEAFRIATEPQRAQEQIDKVAGSAARAAAGKNHMSAVAASGGATSQVSVPEAVMKGYRLSNPNITMEEARKKYARFLGLKRY